MEDKVILGEGIMAQIQRETGNRITYNGSITKKQLHKAIAWKAGWWHHKRFKNTKILSIRNRYKLKSFQCKNKVNRIMFLKTKLTKL